MNESTSEPASDAERWPPSATKRGRRAPRGAGGSSGLALPERGRGAAASSGSSLSELSASALCARWGLLADRSTRCGAASSASTSVPARRWASPPRCARSAATPRADRSTCRGPAGGAATGPRSGTGAARRRSRLRSGRRGRARAAAPLRSASEVDSGAAHFCAGARCVTSAARVLKEGLLPGRSLMSKQAPSLSKLSAKRLGCRQGRAWAVLLCLAPAADARVRGGVRPPDEPDALSSQALELAALSSSSSSASPSPA